MSNFFQSLVDLKVQGDWKISIAQDIGGKLIVSVLYFNEKCGDEARKFLPPMILKGTAEELDEGFISAISQPVKEADGLLTNMEHFMAEKAKAEINSKMNKEKQSKTEKNVSKYEEAMAMVDQLEQDGKPRDAWMKVPDPKTYPEFAEEIRNRKSQLSSQFAPDLFQKEKAS